jgi:DNA-binding winged helix-turn-helix (wHTH) protein/TolB-like protein
MTRENNHIYEFGEFRLDTAERLLLRNGERISLTPKLFATLLVLIRRSGHVVEKDELLKQVWPEEKFVEEANLARNISDLRKKLGENGDQKYIETVPKLGYRFVAPVTVVDDGGGVLIQRRVRARIVSEEFYPEEPPALTEAALPAQLVGETTSLTLGSSLSRKKRIALALVLAAVAAAAMLTVLWLVRRNRPTPSTTAINSMAVLPLRPLTEGESEKSLGLGLTDTLIMKIGGLRQIVVRPISAVTAYSETRQDSLEIGRRLQVDAVLEGTIRQSEGRVRINVRLLRVSNGEQIWAESFEDASAKVFDLEERLSDHTARALQLKLGATENEQITKRFTNNADALSAYQKGRYFWNRRTAGDLRTAIKYFNEAIALDGNYALAYAGLADAHSLLSDYQGALPDETYPKAREAATKALALDDKLAEAHTSLAYVKMYYDRDWSGAEREYRRAITLNPNYASAHQWYAEYLTAMGRFEEALAETRRAKEIDPLSPIINAGEVWTLYFARRYDEAIERGRQIAELNPQFAEIHEYLKRCFDQKGMYAQAIAERQTRRKLVGLDATESPILKAAASANNATDYWKKRLEQEIEEGRHESPAFFNLAEIYAQLGEKDLAFEWLEKAIKNRNYEVMYLRVAPNLDPLRSDERFADALQRLGLLV